MQQALQTRKAVVSGLMALFLAISLFGGMPATETRAATLCVEPNGANGCHSTIQSAITASSNNDTIEIRAGTYKENIIVDKPVTLNGAGQASTILMPAINGPICTIVTATDSICAGHSSVIMVNASNVHIQNLTIDGDNPDVSGGVFREGADVNARNGITNNYYLDIFNNMEVNNVLVKNIYLRGIYESSGGDGTNIHHNTVQNVQGDSSSIGIMIWGGKGVISNNTVDKANDGIVANWSRGIRFLDNTVTNSNGGVHSDNAGKETGSTADLLQGNHVSACKPGGTGVWTFVPYIAPTINANFVEGCAYGLGHWGSRNNAQAVFTNNEVNGTGTTGGAGITISTDLTPHGTENVNSMVRNNSITNFETAVVVEAQVISTNTYNAAVVLENNAIKGAVNGIVKSGTGTFSITAVRNWWGSASGPTVTDNPGGSGAVIPTGVPFAPWLCAETDTSTAPGFQPGTTLCGLASKLIFSTQPGGAGLAAPLNPGPVVRAVDADGNLAINFTGPVTVALDTNPTGASLGGTKTVNAVNGEALFNDISVDEEGEGYTLKASSTNLGEVISSVFNITNLVYYLPIIGR